MSDALVERVAAELAIAMRAAGVHGVLGYLNSRLRYRFTAVFSVEPPVLRNLFLYDRENPSLQTTGGVHPVHETYCSIVHATRSPFTTSDAPHDLRLNGHAARDCVISYLGVPLRADDGRVWGVLCHYDLRPRLTPPNEIEMLGRIAPLMASALHAVTPVPT